MSRIKKTLVIIAVILGAVVLTSAALFLKMNFDMENKTFKTVYTEKEYTITDVGLQLIYIKDEVHNIIIQKSNDEKLRLKYYEDNLGEYQLYDELSEGVMQLNYNLIDKAQSKLGFLKLKRDTTVVLSIPDGYEGAVSAASTDGNIKASGVNKLVELSISSVNGSLTANDLIVLSKLGAVSDNGEVNCSDIMTNNAYIKASNSKVMLDSLELAGELAIESVGGECTAKNIKSTDFDLKTVSGKIDINAIGNGDDYFMKTTPGDGTITVPAGTRTALGTLQAETESGTINVSFSEDNNG